MFSSDKEELLEDDRKERLLGFLRWMELNGVHLRGCAIKPCQEDGEAGFSVYTADNYGGDGILMVTPLALSITPMTALQDNLLGSVFATLFPDGDVDDRLIVMLFLVVERLRRDSSFWAPYLKMLPKKFGMSLCFTDEELSELKGTALYKATIIQQERLRKHFYEKVKGLAETILASVGSFEREVEFEDFLWANCIFWTRALNVPYPQSLVCPRPAKDQKGENEIKSAAVIASSLECDHPETFPDANSQNSEQHGRECFGGKGNMEIVDMIGNFSPDVAVKVRRTDNDVEIRRFNFPASDMETNIESEPEPTVWVEVLVPGIDFCNHATKAAAVWEVDDQDGSTSGVKYSMYLATGITLPSNTEIRINYGNKGTRQELLFLYGFVMDNNPDDYLMVHFPKEALEKSICSEAKFLLLEEQKLPLRWLLPSSLLKAGHVNGHSTKVSPPSILQRFSWTGIRKPPTGLENQVFPEELMTALRIISMTEDEVQGTSVLLLQISDSERPWIPTAEDIRAAVWEVCGNAGALQLLHDLLTAKMLELEAGTGSKEIDSILLEKDVEAQIEARKSIQQGSAYSGDDKNLLSRNKRNCVVYRKGQKQLAYLFLQEVQYALELWIRQVQSW